MYSHNLGLVFGNAEAFVIITCRSDSPIPVNETNKAVFAFLESASKTRHNVKEALDDVVEGLKRDLGYDVSVVAADCTALIVRKPEGIPQPAQISGKGFMC